MKRLLTLITFLLILPGLALADTGAVFTSVTGTVTFTTAKSHKAHPAKVNGQVSEGDRIEAGADGQATLKLFDGSQLQISPNTGFTVEKLQQPGPKDKVIQFKLELGKLLASVSKLLTSKSSFEIEAGGVVCGVRGTEYSMFYDPSTGKVDVLVLDGTVWSTANGQTQEFHAGQGGTYLNGTWTPHTPPSTGTNLPHPGFIASNPFYGFNGTGLDEFNTPLTDLPSGLPGITGQVHNTGIAALGAHNLLNLQLGFPQYLPLTK